MWQHFDDGSCPGQGIGVRTRLENGLSGFILTRNISDKTVNAPEERVHVRKHLLGGKVLERASQEEQNGANFSSVAPSSEEL